MWKLLYLLEAVEQTVGKICKGLLIGGGSSRDHLIEVVVHESALESQVLPDIIPGILPNQIPQSEQIERIFPQPVHASFDSDVSYVYPTPHKRSSARFLIPDL